MKRVLHVMASLERSGMEMMLISSCSEWRRNGYSCDVVGTAREIGPVAAQMRECGYGVFHIPFRDKHRFIPRLRFLLDFSRLCKSNYDVIHIHPEGGRPIFALLARMAGIRQIAVTPHSTFKFHGVLRMRKFLERHFIRFLGGRFGMISEGVSACEWERFRIKGVRIWNWFDSAHFRPPSLDERASARQALGIKDEDFVLLSVGNCAKVKNHNAILRALPLIPKAIHPLYLHVGREEDDMPERSLATQLNVMDRIRFLGSQPDPLPYLWAADVFVMPSVNEGLSIAAMEAIAACAPALFANVAGLSEIAAETRWTVLTTITAESVAEGLVKVAAIEPSERRQRALTDSQRIRARFSIQNGVQSIVHGLYGDSVPGLQAPDRIWEHS